MDVRTNRTTNIRRLVADHGGPTIFAAKFGSGGRGASTWSQAQVGQWISPSKPKGIGHVLAREIERRVGLPVGWLDHHQSGSVENPHDRSRADDPGGVPPISDEYHRRGNLALLMNVHDPAVLADPGDTDPRVVERRLGLPVGWIDQPIPSNIPPRMERMSASRTSDEAALMALYRSAGPELRSAILDGVARLIDQHARSRTEDEDHMRHLK